jgi:hypothetical protein
MHVLENKQTSDQGSSNLQIFNFFTSWQGVEIPIAPHLSPFNDSPLTDVLLIDFASNAGTLIEVPLIDLPVTVSSNDGLQNDRTGNDLTVAVPHCLFLFLLRTEIALMSTQVLGK